MKFTKEHTMQMKGIAIIILFVSFIAFLNAQRWATVPYEKTCDDEGDGNITQFSFAPFFFSYDTISC